MHAYDQNFLIVRTIEDADVTAARQDLAGTPQVVVIEFLRRWLLERVDLASLRIDAGHHVFDRAILPGRIHRLKNHQQAPSILRVKSVLQLRHLMDAALEKLGSIFLGLEAASF